MAVTYARTRLAAAVLGLAALLSACTVHKTEVPSLTGPSTLSPNITIAANPDVLPQDGMSSSTVIITALDNNGQPMANLNLIVDIAVGGVVTDFGRLSSKSVVTDNTGRAPVVYTAPPRPTVIVGSGTTVDIQVTPTGSNFANATPRSTSIQLVPPGVVSGPASSLVPSFVLPSLNVGDVGVFSAKVIDASGNDATNQVASFAWNFGDGNTGSGQSVTHAYRSIGTFAVTLTITDRFGLTNFVTQSLTVGQGQLPFATFVTSPASVSPGQQVFFNASSSTAAPGHFIAGYAWDFGDGASGSGVTTSHTYQQAGSYAVVLQVTDDVGRQNTNSVTVTVGPGGGGPGPGTGPLTASFTVTPSTPTHGVSALFDGSASRAAAGHQITNYEWNWADNTPSSSGLLPVTSHIFAAAGQYVVTLTVTDDQKNVTSLGQLVIVK
jgi:PKD repeat protein